MIRKLIKTTLVAVILATGSVHGEDPVYFYDENLKACIECTLEILDPTPSDTLQLTRLNGCHSMIKDLDGLDYATNLCTLTLGFNEIKDISLLAGLSELESITINDIQISCDATVVNSILWNNGLDNLRLEGTSRPLVSYSNISVMPLLEDPSQAGQDIVSVNPRFVRPGQWTVSPEKGPIWEAGDYHLQSQSGRWDPETGSWVLDSKTSPAIDGGDPAWPVMAEPMPNRERMNMGPYGGDRKNQQIPIDPA